MTWILCAVLACGLLAALVALCREMRLRKALSRLLQLILKYWRSNHD